MQVKLDLLSKYFHHFKTNKERDTILKLMDEYAFIKQKECAINYGKWLNSYSDLDFRLHLSNKTEDELYEMFLLSNYNF